MRILKKLTAGQQKNGRATGSRDREIFHSEFNGLFAEQLATYTLGGIIPVTYAEAQTLITNSSLEEGNHYFLSDKADAGILLLAVTTNQFSLEGQGVFLRPDFQNTYLNNVGGWHSGLAGLVANTSVTIWNGLQYTNLTGVVGTAPDGDLVNWAVIPKTNLTYIQEIDFILYDFVGDSIIEINDKRNNKIVTAQAVENFQFGNDSVRNNTVISNGLLSCINQRGVVINNVVESNGALVLSELHEGTIRFCSFIANQVNGDLDAGIEYTECYFDLIFNITLVPSVSQIDKKISKNESTFEIDLDMTDGADYTLATTTLDITTDRNYFGIFNLLNNTGQTISKISNLPSTHKSRFYVENGNTQLFNHNTIIGAVANMLVSDAAAINTITGRINGSDLIEYEKAGNLNRRYNAVILS